MRRTPSARSHSRSHARSPAAWLFACASLLLTWLALACGSDGSSVAPTPDASTADGAGAEGGPAVRAGVLRVRVSGLPDGTEPHIVVSDATGAMTRVTKTVDLALPPGAYTITAGAAGDQSKPNGDAFRPVEDAQTVMLDATAGVAVDVAYEKVVARISPNAKLASDAAASAIASVTRDANGNGTVVLTAATAESRAWKAGDILLFGVSAKTPRGFFGRVVSTDGTTVVTEQAAIGDVLQDGVMVFARDFGGGDVSGLQSDGGVIDGGLADLRICPSLNHSFTTGGAASVSLTVTGTLCISPSLSIGLAFRGKIVPDVDFSAGIAITGSVDVEGVASIAIDQSITLFTIGLGHYTIWTGPIPWVISPEIEVTVGASGEIKAGVTAGISATVSASGGFHYDSRRNKFSTWSDHATSWDLTWPTPIATAKLRGKGGPKFALIIDELAGPFIAAEAYVELDVDFLNKPLWQLHAGVDLNAGLTTSKIIGKEYSVTLWNYDHVLATSDDTPKLGGSTGAASTAPSEQPIAVGPDDTIYIASDKEVRAYTGMTQKWAYTALDFVTAVALADDGTVYATDFTGGIYALTSAGAKKWSTNLPFARALALPASGAVYVAAGTAITSLSPTNGSVQWTKDLGATAWSVSIAKDGTLYTPTATGVTALTSAGAILWSTPVGAATAGSVIPIAADGTLYVTVFDGPVVLVALAPTGAVKWRTTALWSDAVSASVIGPDGTVYLCGTPPDPRAIAIAPNGQRKWSYAHGEICEAPPAVGADGNVYVLTHAALHALASADGREAWKRSVTSSSGTPSGSPNFLSNKSLVAATSGGMFQLYAGTVLAAGPWPRGQGGAAGTSRAK